MSNFSEQVDENSTKAKTHYKLCISNYKITQTITKKIIVKTTETAVQLAEWVLKMLKRKTFK